MTNDQYSRFMRFLGVLEGYGMGLRDGVNDGLYWDTLENLDLLTQELMGKENDA